MKRKIDLLVCSLLFLTLMLTACNRGGDSGIFGSGGDAQRVELLGDEIQVNSAGQSYVIISADENGEFHYQMRWRVYPNDAADKSVRLVYDRQNTAVSVNERTGVVTFNREGYVCVTVVSSVNTDATATLHIYAQK